MIHAILLLDESGSMMDVREDVVGGFNGYIETLKKEKEGEVHVSCFTFDLSGRPIVRSLFEDKALGQIGAMTLDDYYPSGSTPLNDAVLETIRRVKKFADKEKDSVIFITYTDGRENASRADSQKVKETIAKREAKGWEFVYLGANQDAWSVGSGYGMSGLKLNTSGTKAGTIAMLSSAANVTNTARRSVGEGGKVSDVRATYGGHTSIGEVPIDEPQGDKDDAA